MSINIIDQNIRTWWSTQKVGDKVKIVWAAYEKDRQW